MSPEAWIAVGPIGATLAFCLYLFRVFVKASRDGRSDDKATAAAMVAEAHSERDYARTERDAVEAELAAQRKACQQELAELRRFYEDLLDKQKAEHTTALKETRDEWKTTRNFLYGRIAHLEEILYKRVITPQPEDTE